MPLRLERFRVNKFRNVHDSGWVGVDAITAIIGQNEAGKSNLCEALLRLWPYDGESSFDLQFDWPVDLWEAKDDKTTVIEAEFVLTKAQEDSLTFACWKPAPEGGERPERPTIAKRSDGVAFVSVSRSYDGNYSTNYAQLRGDYDRSKAWAWIKVNLPKFVYVDDYGAIANRIELTELKSKLDNHGWNALAPHEQTVKIILDLAKVDIDDFVQKGQTAEGRTVRSFDKRAASAYLSRQFSALWKQKKVKFDIEIDGPTLNILVEDEGMEMPVPLSQRSTGFRWYVGFAWRFTHATNGDFQNTVLLLEEPGIHLHPAAQGDLLKVFENLADTNQVIYTTHLPSLIDLGHPERLRVVELRDHHTRVSTGLISQSRTPMMVVEAALGLAPEMSGLLGSRKTLIVEGQDDALVLLKLSALARSAAKPSIPDDVYLWAAQGAAKTPMYVGFLIGHEWVGGVLLDGDGEGIKAKEKIKMLYANVPEGRFFVTDLSSALGEKNSPFTIEDILGEKFYLAAVSETYRLTMKSEDLGPDRVKPLTHLISQELASRGIGELDKSRVMATILKQFSSFKEFTDLPAETRKRAEKLFTHLEGKFTALAMPEG